MCYQLLVASVLTLSEVRAMLPAGVRADALGPGVQDPYRALLTGAQTAVVLRAGHCACGLLEHRFRAAHTDEAHLRERYRRLGATRTSIVRAIERHRRSVAHAPRAHPHALARLATEHARNAGPSAWLLGFSVDDVPPAIPGTAPVSRTAAQVVGDPEGWLVEGPVMLVTP